MSTTIPTADTLSEAWARTVEVVSAAGGRLVNVLVTVADPGTEDARIRSVVDDLLRPGRRGGASIQGVETVANTIFPNSLYRDVGFSWSPDLATAEAEAIDGAAADLFETYEMMLPMLLTANGNSSGTYFSRMCSWPGKEQGGTNQLADRIKYLRIARRTGNSAHNASDIAIGGEAERHRGFRSREGALADLGLQVYAATDRRQRAFPCLVHVDLTLFEGRLSMLAVYRHQFLITKAYGNWLGLSHLLRFLSQQTGFPVGELAIQATLADDERSRYGGKQGIERIVRDVRMAQVA